MNLSRVYPGLPELVDLDAAGSRDRLLDFYRPPAATWLRVNLVASVSGNAAGNDGTSESLTSSIDRKLLGVIRELSDVVLVGAQSVRSENFPLPKRSRLAVVTRSGNLDGHRLNPEEGRLFVICPRSAVSEVNRTMPGARVVVVDSDDQSLPPASIVAALADEGFTSIVCEGGPSLIAQFAVHNLLDELCLTTSPVLGGSPLPVLGGAEIETIPLELTQLLVDQDGATFARWAVNRANR